MKKDDIISNCYKIHGNKYDYSLIEKDSNKMDNINVICPQHGIFRPRLARFLQGSNCPQCSRKCLKTKEMFITEANLRHNGFYTYDEFTYINSHTKSVITCPIHGNFTQTPTNHLNGNGCPECKKDNLKEKFTDTKERFIEKANKVHNFVYNYDSIENYTSTYTKVPIVCKKHGVFYQTPNNHLRGKGCPICKQSHLERIIKEYLDENKIEYEQQKKFSWLGKQSLDFYLPVYNIAIECQGKQHFKQGGWAKTPNFEEIIQRDKKKYDLCQSYGIILLYIVNENYNFTISDIYTTENTLKNINDLKEYLQKSK